MANKYTTLNDLFVAIANSIRAKKNSTDTIVADKFLDEINSLKSGFDYENHMVTSITDYEFKNCEDLLSVNCYNLTSVGANAFENCSNLKTIILWNSVVNVDENAFKGCPSDLIIYCMFDSQPETWHENWNPDNCPVVWWGYSPVKTWDISATEEDNVIAKLYNNPIDETKLLTINGNGQIKNFETNDSNKAPWRGYKITCCIIIGSIINISNAMFYRTGEALTSINIPNSVTSIGSYAFDNCSSLTSINIPNSVTSIGDCAFRSCKLLTSITIPDSVTSIDNSVFKNCTSLTSITIPDSVASIDSDAFYNTAYYNNSLNWINDVLYINNHLIKARTNLTGEYAINDGTKNISSSAFYNCTSLTSITIPNSVTRINNWAFKYCTSLISITYTGTITQWNAITLANDWNENTGNYTIHCTDGDIAKS